MNAPNMICFEKKFDNGWADLKITFDHYIEFNTLTNTEFNNESIETAMQDL